MHRRFKELPTEFPRIVIIVSCDHIVPSRPAYEVTVPMINYVHQFAKVVRDQCMPERAPADCIEGLKVIGEVVFDRFEFVRREQT